MQVFDIMITDLVKEKDWNSQYAAIYSYFDLWHDFKDSKEILRSLEICRT